MKKTGFTLIEMVVSVGMVMVLMIAITGILMNSFKAKTSINLTDKIEQNGNFVLTELRKNIINSKTSSMVCPVGVGFSLAVTGKDGLESVLLCMEEDQIASSSASGIVSLTEDDVWVKNCASFVSCTTNSADEVTGVNIGFTLAAGVEGSGAGNYVAKNFEMAVTVRD